MKVYRPGNSSAFIVLKSDYGHTCAPRSGLTKEVTHEIKRLRALGRTPQQIWHEVGRASLQNKRQLYNYLARVKKEKNPIAHLDDLVKWCRSLYHHPHDSEPHRPFVVEHCISAEGRTIRFLVSTPHLLEQTAMGNRLHTDGTYKLLYLGLPVIVVGTTDRNKRFILGGIAVCSGEREEDYEFVFEALKDYYSLRNIEYNFK